MQIAILILNNWIIVLSICIKLVFCFGFTIQHTPGPRASLVWQPFQQTVSTDEYDIAHIAQCYNKGHNFTRIALTDTGFYYRKTSSRPFVSVYIHVVYQRFYQAIFPHTAEHEYLRNAPATQYYRWYALTMIMLSFLLTCISIPSIWFVLNHLFNNALPWLQQTMVAGYILFPSALIYIGGIPLYENLALPCLVIVVAYLVQILQGNNSYNKAVLCGFFSAFSLAIRPQLFLVFTYLILFSVGYIIINRTNKVSSIFKMINSLLIVCLFGVLVVVHTVYLNYTLWNQFVLSTRSDALLCGHNPFARGSWDGNFLQVGTPSYQYLTTLRPDFEQLNEYEQHKVFTEIAVTYIISHPSNELFLCIRKLGIFFLPYEFEHLQVSWPLLLVHLGFWGYLFLIFFRTQTILNNVCQQLCMIVIVGIICVNCLYFVEYRIRYFAYPFMYLLALFFYHKSYILLKKMLKR